MAAPKKIVRNRKPVTRKPAQVEIEVQTGVEQETETVEAQDVVVDTPTAPQRLKPRVPIGQRRPLTIDKNALDPNYEYRHVRGSSVNLQRYLDAGYDFVTEGVTVGDAGIMRGSQTDSRVSISSGDNNDRMYLMRIPKDYYAEDQIAKQQAIDKKEEALKPSAEQQGLSGRLDISR